MAYPVQGGNPYASGKAPAAAPKPPEAEGKKQQEEPPAPANPVVQQYWGFGRGGSSQPQRPQAQPPQAQPPQAQRPQAQRPQAQPPQVRPATSGPSALPAAPATGGRVPVGHGHQPPKK